MAQKKDQNRSTKHTHKTKNRDTRTSLNTGDELRCSGRVSSSCYTSGNRSINLVTNPVIRHGTWLQYWKINVCPCQMMFVSINSKMTGVTSAAVTPNPSRASKFTPELVEFVLLFSFLCSVLQIIIFLFALLRVVIVLSDLRITISNYSFKPFLLFYEVLCRSEFVLFFLFVIVLSVLRLTASDCLYKQSVGFHAVLCRSLYFLLPFFVSLLYCLNFELRFLITPSNNL